MSHHPLCQACRARLAEWHRSPERRRHHQGRDPQGRCHRFACRSAEHSTGWATEDRVVPDLAWSPPAREWPRAWAEAGSRVSPQWRSGVCCGLLPALSVLYDTEHDFYFELQMNDVWVWDVYRSDRFVKSVRVLTFKDVNVEVRGDKDLELPKELALDE